MIFSTEGADGLLRAATANHLRMGSMCRNNRSACSAILMLTREKSRLGLLASCKLL
jgi:hypothetical protein